MTPRVAGRLALLLALALYGAVCIATPGTFRLLDSVDLAIHETGHLVFAPFGEWMAMAGGTIFQLIVPLAFVGHFAWRRDTFGAAVCLWWVAQNCWNIATYIADARAQVLPLVGGGEHDWAYLLSASGNMANDRTIARFVQGLGVLLYIMSIAGGLLVLREEPAAGSLDAAPSPADETPRSGPP
jgi:hypothetical protein